MILWVRCLMGDIDDVEWEQPLCDVILCVVRNIIIPAKTRNQYYGIRK